MKQFVTALLSVILLTGSIAQTGTKIPADPTVRKGVLPNGMTYYIKHNEEPKDRASFYIIQNVGAILEEDNQNGLAHFLEHMAFNGTKNFPDKKLFTYLEGYGVKFGADINAYTSRDETVYNLSKVPVKDNDNLVDSCLLVLHDWSNYLSLDNEEIDNERGVISEEWRTRRNSGFRIMAQTSPAIFKDSKYAKRDVIGDYDIINNFEHQTIKDFYNDWYRTDLQAIAIVGDIDVDKIEAKIKARFSKIPAIENPKERLVYSVPDNDEPIIARATDIESQRVLVGLMFKHKATPKDQVDTEENYISSIKRSLFSSMINTRVSELTQQAEPPFLGGSISYSGMTRTMEITQVMAVPRGNEYEKACKAIFTEAEKVIRFGFTQPELDRVKTSMLAGYERSYNTRAKRSSDSYISEFKSNFLTGDAYPGIEWEFDFIKKTLPNISLAEINQLAKELFPEKNIIVYITGPEKEGVVVPQGEDVLKIWEEVKGMKIEKYVDEEVPSSIISKEIISGKVVKTEINKDLDVTELTLSNGMKVILKPTDLEKDKVSMTSFSDGGTSRYDVKDLPSANLTSQIVNSMGLGDYDPTMLNKILNGKVANASPSIGTYGEAVNGSCAPKDMETMLQMTYLYFEQPRFDSEIFQSIINRSLDGIKYKKNNPMTALQDTLTLMGSNYSPRALLVNEEYFNNVELASIERIYKERIQDADDFTFVFVGDFDNETAIPLIEKYLGSLKSVDREDNWVDNSTDPLKDAKNHFTTTMETPKATNVVILRGETKYNAKNRLYVKTIGELLSKKYLENIREKEGGTYGVGCRGSVGSKPEGSWALQISFDCKPDRAEHLLTLVYKELDEIIEKVDAEDLEEIKTNYLKNRSESKNRNGYWISAINMYYKYDENILLDSSYEDIVNDMDAKSIQKFSKKLLKKANKLEVVMGPAE